MLAESARIFGVSGSATEARIVIPSEPLAVREGLRALFETLLLRTLPEVARGTAEIVLAEALNNIVEHAYARHSGLIEVTLRLQQSDLLCQIEDQGLPMPGEVLPMGELRAFAGTEDLPEGGFGWHLIRVLSHDLHYRRVDDRNHLSFRLETAQSAP